MGEKRQGRVRWTFGVGLSVCIAIGPGPAAAEPPSLSLSEAREVVAPPERYPGSTSIGFTNAGALVKPAVLEPTGEGYAVMSHIRGRGTNHGTSELIAVIAGASLEVRRVWPGSVLAIGNLGFASGEKIPWSVSHQAGRDADLGFYALDTRGRPVDPLPFVRFDDRGEARWRGDVVRFDAARNLALVRALVEAPGTRVQYLFVARWLKAILLAEAGRQRLPADTMRRLDAVLHQPSDSSPHDDHFHLRLFCTVEDRLLGCQDRGPRRDWVDMGDAVVAAHVERLGAVLRMKGQVKLARAAIERLDAMRVPEAAPHLLSALERPEAAGRKAALAALAVSGTPEASAVLVEKAGAVGESAWHEALLDAASRIAGPENLPLAVALAADPDKAVGPRLARKKAQAARARRAVLRWSIAVLGRHGRVSAEGIGALAALVQSRDKKIAAEAAAALEGMTCRFDLSRRDLARLPADAARPDLDAFAKGLRAKDRRLPAELRRRAAVERLLRLLGHRDERVRHCASEALTRVTGHEADPRLRPPDRHRRHWTSWWRDHRGDNRLPP